MKLTEEYQAVYCRKFVYARRTDAKYGYPPLTAQIVLVEDAPDELPTYMPPFSFILQTSDYSQQGVYRFPTPQPWAKMKTLAECTKDRIPGADSGGPNPAQFTRIPTTTNTKEKAVRFRVRLIEGQGTIEVATLACAVLPGGMSGLSAAHSQSQRRPSNGKGGPGADDPDWCAAVEAAVGWRGYLWKDAEPWKGGPQLRDNGTPKALKEDHRICRVLRGEMSWPEMASQWGGKDATGSGFTYHLVGSLYLVGCEIPQIIALVEVLDPQARSKGDSWFYHQNLWGCLYRTGNEHQGWAVLKPHIPRRPWKKFTACRVETIPDVERSRRGRKPGAQASMVDHVAALLVEGEAVTRKILRDRLAAATGRDVSPRTLTRYMGQLSAQGLVDRDAAQGEHYRVIRGGVASNSTLVDAIVRGGVASNRGGSHSHRFGASQCEVDLQGDHTPPVLPGMPVLPACSGASHEQPSVPMVVATPEPSGGCDLPVLPAPTPHVVQTAPEPVATPAPPWTLVQCDRTGYPTTYGVHWKAQGPDGTVTDVCDHKDEATFWARRRWGCLPVVAPEPQPAPEQPHDGSGAAIEDCAAHDEKTTSQEGSGATEQTFTRS